jgi:hypothetical protein
MVETVEMLKTLYETKWLPAFDNLDNRHVLSPDRYLFGREPMSKEREQQIREDLYARMGASFSTREEFDQTFDSFDSTSSDRLDEAMAHFVIHFTYEDKEMAKTVWEFIKLLKDDY